MPQHRRDKSSLGDRRRTEEGELPKEETASQSEMHSIR